ncbi:type IV pilus biogenesis protein PilM [Planctomicrobium sp. SH527]|uniref:type IV pilus biogenesis protein PilM n=1 Tax=Planctomicrobium sp. SH527 TaxID=3448123 RepID=UPI003F5CAEAB
MSEEIALEWFRDRIDALSAKGQAAREESVDHADPLVPAVQAGGSLHAWLQRAGLPGGKAVLVLPRESVVMRRLQLPLSPENELPDLVRFQAATKTAAPIDSLVLDYLPLPVQPGRDGQDVIAISIDRDKLARMKAVCDAAGLEVTRVTLASLGVGRFLRTKAASDLGIDGPDLVVYQQHSQVELSIFDEGSLVLSHVVHLADDAHGDALKPLNMEITRLFMALVQTRGEVVVTRCFYLSGTPHPGVQNLLEQRFGAGLKVIDPTETGRGKSVPGFEALSGALTSSSDPSLSIDLLHPRKRVDAPDRRKLYFSIAGISAALLLAGGSYWFYSTKGALENQVAVADEEIRGQEEFLKKGKPRSDAHARVVRWMEGDPHPVELWSHLHKYFPGRDRVYLQEFRIVPMQGAMIARFTGKGRARDRSDVDFLQQSLSDNGYRVRPNTPALGNRDPDFPWQFDLDVELPRTVIAPPASKGPAKTPAPAVQPPKPPTTAAVSTGNAGSGAK